VTLEEVAQSKSLPASKLMTRNVLAMIEDAPLPTFLGDWPTVRHRIRAARRRIEEDVGAVAENGEKG
jgi:hypothetical protein